MIVKKIKCKKTSKTRARQISDLVDYIRQPHGVDCAEKIEHSGSRNFLASRHESQRMEMIALATESIHSRMPVSHYVFSWKSHEQPTTGQVDELVDIFLDELGLEGCQTVYGLHWNTKNYHMHIAVNRMPPVTLKVIDPNNGFDIEAAHKVVALVEHRQGWVSEANARYRVDEAGQVAPRPRKSILKPKQAALDIECATGEKSAQRVAQERGHEIIATAKNWEELHANLAAVGLRFERKGSGAIIFVGDVAVKASSVDRAFSLGKLQKRLGDFKAGDYTDERPSIKPEPVSPINQKLWREYHAECEAMKAEKATTEPGEAAAAVRQIKKRHKEKQATLHEHFREHPRCILNIARHFLKLQQQEELRQLRRRTPKMKFVRRLRFEDWLRKRGLDYQADRWRYRSALEALPEDFRGAPTVLATPTREPHVAYAAYMRQILKDVPDTTPDRLNASIALQMRKTGFTREVVEDTLFQCAPQTWPEPIERDWRRYAQRTAACAFGMEGDTRLARGLAAKANQRQAEKEKAETQPRPQEERQTTAMQEEKDAPRPVQRMRVR